ncbi:MAG: hypothetical protein IPO97_13300 [Sphingomonadales bacterium]|nr:hypothetical protein [Sphingomonadales bacterium]
MAQQILDHREFERIGVIARIGNHARQHDPFLAFVRNCKGGKIAPASRLDFQAGHPLRSLGQSPAQSRRVS